MNHEFCYGEGATQQGLKTKFHKLTSKYLRKYERFECYYGRGEFVENRYFRMGNVSLTFFRYITHGSAFPGT